MKEYKPDKRIFILLGIGLILLIIAFFVLVFLFGIMDKKESENGIGKIQKWDYKIYGECSRKYPNGSLFTISQIKLYGN